MSVSVDVPAHLFNSVHPHDEHPSDFLGKGWDYGQRIEEAQRRIVRTIRFLRNTPQGTGFNLEVHGIEPSLEALAHFIDRKDAKRSLQVRDQRGNKRPVFGDRYWIRSPRQVQFRRRSLFSIDDLEPTYILFYTEEERKKFAYESFLDWMRLSLIHEALKEMRANQEIELMNGIWYLKVSTLDRHRKKYGSLSRSRVKADDRSYHGRPNRDRKR